MEGFEAQHTFSSIIKDSFIIFIPHSSPFIPDLKGVVNPYEMIQDVLTSTDWFTDEIYKVPEIDTLIVPFSRNYCDTERHLINESMEEFGRGFFYTHSVNNIEYRIKQLEEIKQVELVYYSIHNILFQLVTEKLIKHDICYILDVHSFNESPLSWEKLDRPDICLGTDSFHTPSFMVQYFKNTFEREGYTVAIDTPYAGAMVPFLYYKKEPRVNSIMIEINKKLYMPEGKVDYDKIKKLNMMIQSSLEF